MDWVREAGAVVSIFLLRLGIPLAVTLGVAYFLRRLDARWQAEAWADWAAHQSQDKIAATKQLQPGKQPCWSIKGCDEAARANCPAPKHPSIPCWLARRRSEGKLPRECYNCGQFALRQVA